MESMKRSTARLIRPSPSALLAAAVLLTPALATEVEAQSDAGTVNATVTVQAEAISVTGTQDLAFGTHFASDGVVANEQGGAWGIDVSTDPTFVDLTLTLLPTQLSEPGGATVPLLYQPDSFGALCAGIFVTADPGLGISNCEISPGFGVAVLGEDTVAGVPAGPIHVDLSGATAGIYTATVELTATVN